jgi:hypothetical protein
MVPSEKIYYIFKRAGLNPAAEFSAGASPGLGLYTETGFNTVFAAFGGSVYEKKPGATWSYLRAIDSSNPYFFETMLDQNNPGSRTVVMGNTAANYAISTQSTATSGPATFGTLPFSGPTAWGYVYLNGLLYVMDVAQARIWNTVLTNDPSQWDANSYQFANSNADLGVALAKQLNYLLALKQYTTQVYYDAGTSPGSPLGAVPDSQMPLGCLAGTSVQEIDNTLLWLTSNETISPQVVQVDNLVPKIVSTPSVDRILDNIAWNNPNLDIRSWVLKHGGHRFYGLVLVRNDVCLIYDIDQQAWYIWTDPYGHYWPIVAMAYFPPANGNEGLHITQHISDGTIRELDGDYEFPNDAGKLFPVDIYTPIFDAGVDRRKHLNVLRFDADKAPGSVLEVRYSDDDYQSWSNFRHVDLSLERPFLDREGTFYRRAYHFRHKSNTALRLKAVDLQIDIGTL